MSNRNEFLESFEGRRYRYRNQMGKNSIFISYKVEKYQTKRSKSLKENIKFQKFVLSELKRIKKNCFRAKVAIEFSFKINQSNSPAIQSLLKHYIDLIQKPQKEIATRRKYLLIKDDSQIKALSAHYWKSNKNEEQELTISIRPFRDFIYNLEFARDLEFGKFSNRKIYSFSEDNEYEESLGRLNDLNYNKPVKIEGLKIEIDGKEIDYNQFRNQLFEEEKGQQFLKINSKSSASSILTLITEQQSRERNNSILSKTLNKIERVTTLNGRYNINFGSVPVSQGESKLFKDSINKKLKEWKSVNGKLLPKNPALALKFFYEKPSKVNHDLDNLLKYVLPHFNELINKDRYFKDVTSIEIYQIHTISKNKNSGNLYLRIEDLGNNNMFHITESLLEKYE